ncbi:Crp/Fnr family transcriptional regulator [Caenispirillum salinarum]|uniref:Crp/Fnr family transcriptional regulator n=1 Tax=Caenispirillum salinarum TaxID=859058 RepID=UPI00384AD8FB
MTTVSARTLETLGRIPLYASLPPEEIARLDTRCGWKRYEPGQWILDYDEDGTDVFFVTVGRVRVLIRTVGGQDVILRDIGDGEFFGELAALDGAPRSAGILAVTAVTVGRMSASVFRETLHRWPDACNQVLALLAGQVRRLSARVNEYGTLNARHRIYAELLRLSRPSADGRTAVVSPPPTHAELGARVAARREAVNRELRALEKAGLLEKRRGGLCLTNPDRLLEMIREAEEE